MTIFYLPDLGEGLAEAIIHEWYIQPGEILALDQIMLSVETAKALVDIPSPYEGYVQQIFAKVGDTIKTGGKLIDIATKEQAATVAGKLDTHEIILPPETPLTLSEPSLHIQALPAVRALAKKYKIDLNEVQGSGPQGQITSGDLENATKKLGLWQNQAAALTGARLSMAHNMQQAQASVVAATIFEEADITDWTAKTDMTCKVIQALCAACQAEPALNAWYDHTKQVRLLHDNVHIGLAMDTPEGLFVPVIQKAEALASSQLRDTIQYFKRTLAEKKFASALFQGATISLSNIGMFAGKFATPIILPPTVAIIAMGRIDRRRQVLPLSLSFDHRVVTGGEASRFLAVLLENIASKSVPK